MRPIRYAVFAQAVASSEKIQKHAQVCASKQRRYPDTALRHLVLHPGNGAGAAAGCTRAGAGTPRSIGAGPELSARCTRSAKIQHERSRAISFIAAHLPGHAIEAVGHAADELRSRI